MPERDWSAEESGRFETETVTVTRKQLIRMHKDAQAAKEPETYVVRECAQEDFISGAAAMLAELLQGQDGLLNSEDDAEDGED